ncbi:hypothetical protein JNW90_24710 [Micromonospora sp. STR1s_5]|nr:hypothetical protein [Micromonospora sp. STR1s_5]
MHRVVRGAMAAAALWAGLAGPALAGKKDDTLRWATVLSITSADPYYNSFP